MTEWHFESDEEVVATAREIQISMGGFWYVMTPYSHNPDKQAAFDQACAAAAWLMAQGVRVFCPIAHSHPVAAVLPPETHTHNFWMDQDYPLVRSAIGGIVVKMPGWDTSRGVTQERQWFLDLCRPVFFLSWPLPGAQAQPQAMKEAA